jgi:hypothetical protein
VLMRMKLLSTQWLGRPYRVMVAKESSSEHPARAQRVLCHALFQARFEDTSDCSCL